MPSGSATAAFYELDGELVHPTELTQGPWAEGAQHAGPPAALLGRALERLPTTGGAEMRVARVTYEVLRPVPIAPLHVAATIERDGRRVQMCSASLFAGEEEVMRARGWRLRTQAVGLSLPAGLEPPGPPAGPEAGEHERFFPTGARRGYHTAVEYRFVRGAFLEPGPATVWMRARVPLVAGEDISPLQRVLVVADSGNGVSATLDWREYLFINVDLSVHLSRPPDGAWVCLDAVTFPEEDGVGLADTALYDERGRIGRAVQSLLVARR